MMKITKDEYFTIPNLMGYFRVLLIPVFAWRYLTAQSTSQFLAAAAIIGLSGLTDLFDGKIARKFNQVTELGKLLDPLADKLTLGAVIFCLSSRYEWMAALVILFIVKEGFMGVMGLLTLRHNGRKLDGAFWYGKVCTAVLYGVMVMLLIVPRIPRIYVNVSVCLCGIIMLFTLLMYIPVFIKMWKLPKN